MAQITLSTFQFFPAVGTGYSPSKTTCRFWYNRSFLDSDGQFVEGGGNGSNAFYVETDCTVTSGVVEVPSTVLITTVDAQDPNPQSIQCYAQLFSNGSARASVFAGAGTPNGWVIYNPDPLTSWTLEQLTLLNQASYLANPPTTYPTTQEMIDYVNSITYAPATTSSLGLVEISATPANPLIPIVVSDTDVRVNSNYPLRLTLPYSGSSVGAQLRALKMSGGVATLTIAGDTSGCIALGFSAGTNEVVAVGQGYGVCAVDNTVAIGDYLQISSSANGNLHSAGSTYPSSDQVVGRALSIDVDGVCALDFFGSEVRGLPMATSAATANTLVQRNSNAAATVYDLGGQVFNPRAYGATGNGTDDDVAAFRLAVSALESTGKGGEIFVPSGNYRWATPSGGALLTITQNQKFRVAEGAKIIIDSGIGGATDWILVKPAANYVMNAFSVEGGTFEPSNWNQIVGYVSPGRDGVRFDLTNSGSQIRNMRIVGNTWRNTNRPWNTNITHADAFFTNYFEENYLLGAPNFGAGTGDTIILQNNSITSLQADQAMEFTQVTTGATSCVLLNNNITCGGGVIFHSGVNPTIIGGIIECANASLTTGTTTALVYFRGDVQTIENPIIQCVTLVSVGTALNGVKLGATNKAIIGDGIAYNLPAANFLLDAGAASFATLLGQNWPITGGGGGDGVTGAGYASVDTQFAQRLKSYKQPSTVLLQQGSLYLSGQMFSGSGASAGFGFGAAKPQILSGTGDPSGVVSALRNSIWIRDDAAGIYINTTAGTGTTWTQLTVP